MEVMDRLKDQEFRNPLLGTRVADDIGALGLAAPSECLDAADLPIAPVVPKLKTKTWKCEQNADDEYTGTVNDFEALPAALCQYSVLLEVKRRADHEIPFLDAFLESGAISYLPFTFSESYELVRSALKRNVEVASIVNWEGMCDVGIGLFTDRILHLYSFVLRQTQVYHERTYAPLLNHYADFMSPEFAKGFVRILIVLWRISQPAAVRLVLVAGLYSNRRSVVEHFLKAIVACDICAVVDSEILAYHLKHLPVPALVVSVLLRQPRVDPFFIDSLKPLIPSCRGAVVLLCRLAAEEVGARVLLHDLEWLQYEQSLQIALVLLQAPPARPAVLGSPHFDRFRATLTQIRGSSDSS
jgi:hypothetical protein